MLGLVHTERVLGRMLSLGRVLVTCEQARQYSAELAERSAELKSQSLAGFQDRVHCIFLAE